MRKLTMIAVLATLGSFEASAFEPDYFITVRAVELPEHGLDTNALSLVVRETVLGCRRPIDPIIDRQTNVIRIYLQSEPAKKGRAPCATNIASTVQLVSLGKLTRGTYRVQIITARSKIAKILNIY